MTGILVRRLGHRHAQGEDDEDTGRRQPSTSQGGRPQKKSILMTPYSWTSNLQLCEKISFSCWIHQVYGTLLGQLEKLMHVIMTTSQRKKLLFQEGSLPKFSSQDVAVLRSSPVSSRCGCAFPILPGDSFPHPPSPKSLFPPKTLVMFLFKEGMQESSADQDEETNVSGLNIWKPTRRRGQRKSSVIRHAQEYFKHIKSSVNPEGRWSTIYSPLNKTVIF